MILTFERTGDKKKFVLFPHRVFNLWILQPGVALKQAWFSSIAYSTEIALRHRVLRHRVSFAMQNLINEIMENKRLMNNA